jgi:hypothetical protein
MSKKENKDKEVVGLTEEEARAIIRVFRSSGWHRRRELKTFNEGSSAVRDNSHILKKLEEALGLD